MPTERARPIVLSLFTFSAISLGTFLTNPELAAAVPADPNLFYYSRGDKIPLTLSKDLLAVRFKQDLSLDQQEAIVDSEEMLGPFPERQDLPIFKITLLPLREGVTQDNVIQTMRSLDTRSNVEAAFPVFGLPDPQLILTGEFIVKFVPSVSEQKIAAFNALHNVQIVRKPEWTHRYTLRVKDPTNMNTLKTANLYSEDPITVLSVPNFIGKLRLATVTPNDLYFPQQWPLTKIRTKLGTVTNGMKIGAHCSGSQEGFSHFVSWSV
jgi:hypothetical protein